MAGKNLLIGMPSSFNIYHVTLNTPPAGVAGRAQTPPGAFGCENHRLDTQKVGGWEMAVGGKNLLVGMPSSFNMYHVTFNIPQLAVDGWREGISWSKFIIPCSLFPVPRSPSGRFQRPDVDPADGANLQLSTFNPFL